MTEIWLVRHGQTEYNVQDRVQGMANSALTARGVADAGALGRGLSKAAVHFDAAFASDLTRAADTARHALDAAGQAGLALTLDAGLREENYGKFEGQLTDDFAQAVFGLPDFTQALLDHRLSLAQIADGTYAANHGGHGAEDNTMVQQRFDNAMRGIVAAAPEQNVLVVAHGTVVLMWLALLGFDTHGQEMLHNCSVTRVSWDGARFAVGAFDDLGYVVAGRASADARDAGATQSRGGAAVSSGESAAAHTAAAHTAKPAAAAAHPAHG
ncbi:histidine phosphatase family protein [Lacticaseibacillus kribbianus]|uniref:histidine phosphatase family protein n=1 Tax=Lacticaseibacillus kribbianus TaxID=2926292 RepID=UPI001CD6EB9C|nr:histidine phosphatase family protein [Lacticaseibacillus kribbianus]